MAAGALAAIFWLLFLAATTNVFFFLLPFIFLLLCLFFVCQSLSSSAVFFSILVLCHLEFSFSYSLLFALFPCSFSVSATFIHWVTSTSCYACLFCSVICLIFCSLLFLIQFVFCLSFYFPRISVHILCFLTFSICCYQSSSLLGQRQAKMKVKYIPFLIYLCYIYAFAISCHTICHVYGIFLADFLSCHPPLYVDNMKKWSFENIVICLNWRYDSYVKLQVIRVWRVHHFFMDGMEMQEL